MDLSQIGPEHVAAGSALGVVLLREFISIFKDSYRKNNESLQQNTLAIVRLECGLKALSDKIDIIPKLKQDVDSAHDRIREIKSSQSPPN